MYNNLKHENKSVCAVLRIASHAGVLRGVRISWFSSLPTNAVCGEGRNTSSPKNVCVGGYATHPPLWKTSVAIFFKWSSPFGFEPEDETNQNS